MSAESEKIEYEDLINPEAEKKIIEFIAKVKSDLEKFGSDSIKNLPKIDDKPRLTDLQKEIALQKQLEEAKKGLTSVEKLEVQLSSARASQRKQERNDIAAQSSLYTKLSQQLINQKKAVKDLLASKKELSSQDKELIENTKELDKRLKEIDATVGDNQRNVGAYKEALQDAAAEFGIFGGVISRITRTLKTLEEQGEHSQTKMQKLGNVLKAVGVGMALALVTMAAKAIERGAELVKTLEDEAEKLNAYKDVLLLTGKAWGTAQNAMANYIESIQKARETTRAIELNLQAINLELEDQNEIAADATIGYNERIEAQKKAIDLSVKAASLETIMAKGELARQNMYIANLEQMRGKGNVANEILNKRAEAQKKYNEAIDKEADLERQNATKIRAINEAKSIQEIDLILKAKESANARKTILENELKDNKIQLDERKKIAQDLLTENKKTTQEEISEFKKGFNIKFNANKLLLEQDARILQQKILALKTEEGHGLGEVGVVELAKIVKQYQENEIANQETKKKLHEEEIKNLQRIAQIEKEIAIIELQQNQDNLKFAIEEQKQKYSDEKTKKNFDALKFSIDQEFGYREEILREQAELEIQAQKDKQENEKVTAEEIKKINAKLYKDLNALHKEQIKTDEELEKERLNDVKVELSKEVQAFEQVTDGMATGLQKREELQQQSDQRMIDFHTRTADIEAQLAAGGKANTLAQEQAQAAKAEEKKIQDAKRAAKVQETIAVISTFQKTLSTALNANKPFPQAFGEALASSGLIEAEFTKLFAGFYEGTESLGESDGMKIGNGKDNILIRAHKGERILGVDDSAMIPKGMSNEDVVNASLMYANGLNYIPQAIFVDKKAEENYLLAQKLDKVIQAIETQPKQSTNLDAIGEWTETTIEKGIKISLHHKKMNNRPSLRLHG